MRLGFFIVAIIATVIISPSSAHAQTFGIPPDLSNERAKLDTALIENCLKPFIEGSERDLINLASAEGRACAGQAASKCLDESDVSGNGIYDRISYMNCYGLERAYWQWRMDKATRGLEIWSEERTTDLSDPEAPLTSLHAAIGATKEYIEARCVFEAAIAYGGREAGIHEQACRLRLTAQMALGFEFDLRAYCGTQRTVRFDRICKGEPF